MVYPVLQEKFARDKKNIAPIYPALLLRFYYPLALMESAHSDLISPRRLADSPGKSCQAS